VQLVCVDDKSDASLVRGIYENLLDVEKVDLVLGGYGNNSLTPAMPLIVERHRYFVGLVGLGVNARFGYAGYFVMIPTGPEPNTALTAGFFRSRRGRSRDRSPSRSSRPTRTSRATRSPARTRMPRRTAFASFRNQVPARDQGLRATVVSPDALASGELIYPYRDAKRAR
jgi:hypothetical protein